MIESSIVYRFFAGIGNVLLKFINGSFLVDKFLTEDSSAQAETEGSIFYKIYSFLRNILSAIFSFLRFDRLFEGSIFKMNFLWMAITAVFAPIVPTKLVILMAAAGFGSLLLAIGCDR